jgi:hypothetical protein
VVCEHFSWLWAVCLKLEQFKFGVAVVASAAAGEGVENVHDDSYSVGGVGRCCLRDELSEQIVVLPATAVAT